MRTKKKNAEWRNEKRAHGGSIRERKGLVFARIQWTDEQGKRREQERPARHRKHARELITQMRDELSKHGQAALDTHKMTFADLAAQYESKKLFKAQYVDGRKVAGVRSLLPAKSALAALVSHFGRKSIRAIKHSDIEGFKLKRLQTPIVVRVKETSKRATRRAKIDLKGKARQETTRQRSITAVNRELELMRAMMRFAQREGWLFKSPFEAGAPVISKASERSRDRVLTPEEELRLLNACTGRREHLGKLLICALDTGMRRGELFKLVWSDMDFSANLIRVRATNTKTETARTVGMTPRVRECLLGLRELAPPQWSGSVFGIRDTVKTAFASALLEAKIDDFRLHDCRHTAITRMIQAGMAAAEVMKISGHTQWNTFARYVHVNEQAARKGADMLAEHHAKLEAQARANASAGELVSVGIN
jgi:integrase